MARSRSEPGARSRTAVGAIVLLLAVTGCRVSALDRLIFFPDRHMPPPPPGVEERRFTTSDGVSLHAWYAPSATGPPAPTLLWAHGNGGNVANREDVVLALAARGVNVLAYDYRGYGLSGGTPSEAGVYRDATAAYEDLIARGVPASSIVCFGESLGGAVSIELATRNPCAAVIVVSTFTQLRDVARAHYGALASLAGRQFDSASRVGALTVPIFVAHGDRDEIVPYALGEQLFAAAREPKTFLRVPGKQHNDVFDSRALLDAIATFARDATAAASAPSSG